MEADIMTREDTEMLNFLLSTDFHAGSGLTYPDALEFLHQYKKLYRQLYDNYYYLVQQEKSYNRTLSQLQAQIELLENKLKVREFQIKNMEEVIIRKLTWKERIFGKLKL